MDRLIGVVVLLGTFIANGFIIDVLLLSVWQRTLPQMEQDRPSEDYSMRRGGRGRASTDVVGLEQERSAMVFFERRGHFLRQRCREIAATFIGPKSQMLLEDALQSVLQVHDRQR